MGKPGTFIKRGQARPVTVALRLARLENMVGGGGGDGDDDVAVISFHISLGYAY